jgi:hypothetical protein
MAQEDQTIQKNDKDSTTTESYQTSINKAVEARDAQPGAVEEPEEEEEEEQEEGTTEGNTMEDGNSENGA